MTLFMKGIISSILNGGKLFENIRQLLDEIVTTKEERERLELEIKEAIQQHEKELFHAELEDRKSARTRESDALKSGSINLTQNVLAYGAIVAFFFMTGFIIANGIGDMNTEESFIVGNLTGMAAAIEKDIYGYYFGSSKGEHEAGDLLRRNKSI